MKITATSDSTLGFHKDDFLNITYNLLVRLELCKCFPVAEGADFDCDQDCEEKEGGEHGDDIEQIQLVPSQLE